MEALGVCPFEQHCPELAPTPSHPQPRNHKSDDEPLPTFEFYVDPDVRKSTDYYANFLSYIICREYDVDGSSYYREAYKAAINYWPDLPTDNFAVQHSIDSAPMLVEWLDKAKKEMNMEEKKKVGYESGYEGDVDTDGSSDYGGGSSLTIVKSEDDGLHEAEEEEDGEEDGGEEIDETEHDHELCSGSDADDEVGVLLTRKKNIHVASGRKVLPVGSSSLSFYPVIYPIMKRKRDRDHEEDEDVEEVVQVTTTPLKRRKSTDCGRGAIDSDASRNNSKGKTAIRADLWGFTDIISSEKEQK